MQVDHHLKNVSEWQSTISDNLHFAKAEKIWKRASCNKKMGGKLLVAVLCNMKIYNLLQELQRDLQAITSRDTALESGGC